MKTFPRQEHRAFLAARTFLNKVAVPSSPKLTSPEQKRALIDLTEGGYLRCIDVNVFLPHAAPFPLNIYRLTDAGIALCHEHQIEAVDP